MYVYSLVIVTLIAKAFAQDDCIPWTSTSTDIHRVITTVTMKGTTRTSVTEVSTTDFGITLTTCSPRSTVTVFRQFFYDLDSSLSTHLRFSADTRKYCRSKLA